MHLGDLGSARLLLGVCAILLLGLAGCRTLPQPALQPGASEAALAQIAISLEQAAALDAEGDYAGAERSATEALALADRHARPDDPSLPALLFFLARQNLNRAHFEDARRHIDRAWDLTRPAMAQRVQPVRTDLIARALTRLEVELAVLEGRPERAEAAIRRLLARQQEELGPRHPFVGQSLSLFARLADAQERFEPGATLWTEARAIFRNAWGERHPDVAWTTLGLANNRTLAGQPEEAERLAREATAIAAALAREAPADQRSEAEANHGRMLSLRAEIDLRAERFEDARDGLERALPLLRDRLGPGHPETAWARVLLGETLSRLGGFDRAEAHLSGGMEAIRRAHGDRHPVYGGALMHRAAAYASAGWFAEATADFEEARLIRERILEREEKV